ncbi:MAG: sigma-70 family RNA polymerase sigma factor [Herpetosiphonaceae bacterium]|nr:sigma-70 family RNA polymerase sigma factor [Herpetosiphonaceae bacterium]
MEPHSEELGWIERSQQGDHAAFAQLVEAYQGPVYNLAYRMLHDAGEAEDATQEIFLRAYTKLVMYDRERKFITWLLSIASNYCIDQLRRRRANVVTLDDIAYAIPSTVAGPERRALDQEQRTAIQRAVNQLPDTYRLITVLRYYQDFSYEEIEAITGLSEATVKTRLFRARRMLQELLIKEGGVPWIVEPAVHS